MLKIRNGKIWRDTKGNVIHCHGGGFLKQGDFLLVLRKPGAGQAGFLLSISGFGKLGVL